MVAETNFYEWVADTTKAFMEKNDLSKAAQHSRNLSTYFILFIVFGGVCSVLAEQTSGVTSAAFRCVSVLAIPGIVVGAFWSMLAGTYERAAITRQQNMDPGDLY